MAAQLIEPHEVIQVDWVPMLIFGPPGSGKTSIAQTADTPLSLDFDKGTHRCFNRQRAVRFDCWEDVLEFQGKGGFKGYKTIVVDTLGRLLDCMIPVVKNQSAKNRGPSGLSPQGYGVLGGMFADWMRGLRDAGHDLVLVAHEREGENAQGHPIVRPDLVGKMAWSECSKWIDLIGYLRYEERAKFLEFSPNECWTCCKNAAGWGAIRVPKLEETPRFLADLLADAKKKMGKTAEASAALAAAETKWSLWLAEDPRLEDFNARLPELGQLPPDAKRRVWALLTAHAAKYSAVWDPRAKAFVRADEVKGGAA